MSMNVTMKDLTPSLRRFNIFGKNILIPLLILAFSGVGFAAEVTFKGPYDDETVQQRDARMAWWREVHRHRGQAP